MDYSYKLKHGNPSLEYFSDHPIIEWSFTDFARSFDDGKIKPTKFTKIKNTYISNIKDIQKLNVPDFVKKEVRRLLSLIESPEEESPRFSVNITAHDSNVYNASVSGTLNFNQQSAEKAQQQKDVESVLPSLVGYPKSEITFTSSNATVAARLSFKGLSIQNLVHMSTITSKCL
ncbi:hypothetical protein [Parasitella parasitica]|uniref:Uncharacterized protein n=1 Tax=Parasitella parasitica TaxID=35722 RepID=A0A0B7MW61_9FUNG|nr:hypothetical protein [Parasitella parasitica]